MQDRPTATELLDVLGEFLAADVQPNLTGPAQYRGRVASNLVAIVARELELGPAMIRRERDLLIDLLDVGVDELQGEDPGVDVLELNRRLAERLANPAAADPVFVDQARSVLEAVARDKLTVARPGYDTYDSAGDIDPTGRGGAE